MAAKFITEDLKINGGISFRAQRVPNSNEVMGGFGEFEYEEQVIVKWNNLDKSKSELSEQFIAEVIDILINHPNILFKTFEIKTKR